MLPGMTPLLANAPVPPPVFVAGSGNSRGSGTSNVVVTKPTGVVDGDWLYAFIYSQVNVAAPTISGWTQVYYDNAATQKLTILKRQASSEGASYSVFEPTTGSCSVSIVAYRGGLGDVDVVGTVARAGTTVTSTASSITATVNGVLLASFGRSATFGIATPPSGMTQRNSEATSAASAVYDLTPSPAGATGTKTLVWNSPTGTVTSILMQIK